MFQHICYNNEIRIWWDKRDDKTEDRRYRIIVDGGAYVLTDNNYYDFPNLEQGREYEFELQLIDKDKNIIGRRETVRLSTLIKREVIDVTKPPYNAVGDGETDNTEALQLALKDAEYGKTLYFPFGIYICDKVEFSGNVDMRFDGGAVICNREKEQEL